MQTNPLPNERNFLSDKIDFESVRAEKQRIATWYGVAAGVVFALVAWGFDAFQLARSHAMFPWLPFILGLAVSALIGGLAGWVTYRINSLLAAFLSWLAAGIAFAWLAGHISFTILEQAIAILDPTLGQMISYPINDGIQTRMLLINVVVVGLSIVAGMLEITLADSTANASGTIGRYIPMLAWVALFALAGLSVENNLSAQLRKPVVNVNALVQYALDHPNEPLNSPSNPDFRTGALLDIQPHLNEPRRLILQQYDDSLYDITVIGTFGSTWVTCSVSNGQPVYCKPASPEDLK